MEKLLQPDGGLIIWTIVTFLVLVMVLAKTTWKPILKAIEDREGKIRSDIERAEKSQAEAEALRLKYESQLAEAQKSIQEMISQARRDGDKTRADLVVAAKQEAERILEKGRKDLAGETDKLKLELKAQVAELSLAVAEKILQRAVDKKVQAEVLGESLKALSEVGR